MDTRIDLRTAVLALLAVAVGLGLLLAPHGMPAAAAAGSNSANGTCVKAFNYADPQQDWLYASSEAYSGCWYVRATIHNKAFLGGGPGFEDSNCNGTEQWGTHWAELFAGVSAYEDTSLWQRPCSQHEAQPYSGWWPFSSGAIYFKCSLRSCVG